MADNRLIPDSIRDENTEALNALIDRLGTIDLTPLLIYIIDNVTVSALPHLADQFRLLGDAGWLLADNETTRRELIKNAIEKKRYKGTPYGLRRALESLGLSYTYQEWYEYGGQPYHFKVSVTVSSSELSAKTIARLENYINEHKRFVAKLDVIDINLVANGQVPVYAIGLQSSERITVYPKEV